MDDGQTVLTLIRRRFLRRLIWVYTVCSGLSVRILRINRYLQFTCWPWNGTTKQKYTVFFILMGFPGCCLFFDFCNWFAACSKGPPVICEQRWYRSASASARALWSQFLIVDVPLFFYIHLFLWACNEDAEQTVQMYRVILAFLAIIWHMNSFPRC